LTRHELTSWKFRLLSKKYNPRIMLPGSMKQNIYLLSTLNFENSYIYPHGSDIFDYFNSKCMKIILSEF